MTNLVRMLTEEYTHPVTGPLDGPLKSTAGLRSAGQGPEPTTRIRSDSPAGTAGIVHPEAPHQRGPSFPFAALSGRAHIDS